MSTGAVEAPAAPPAGWRRWLRRGWWVVYLLLVLASQTVQWFGGPWYTPSAASIGSPSVTIPAMSDSGPVAGRRARITYLEWTPSRPVSPVPVILLHGSPGQAMDFALLGPRLGGAGYRTIAIDLPGFGNSSPWVPSYSIESAARSVLAALDELGIGRAHVVGWSNGGGVALWMAELAPDRLESITMMASIGLQEGEGSGGYYFEHFKYAVGYAALVVLPELIPHFGLMGDLESRHAFIRSFWDTDQRPLEAIMRNLTAPTLILHGRNDFLTPAWAAERHHELIAGSRLVMLPSSHFIPFLQADEATLHLSMFFRDVESGAWARNFEAGGEVFDEAPYVNPLGMWGERADRLVRGGPWWAVLLALAALTVLSPTLAAAVAGYFVGRHQLDLALATGGVSAGLAGEALLMWSLGRIGGFAAARLPIVRGSVGVPSGRVSAIDWSRRLGLSGGGRVRLFRLGLVSRFQPWTRAQTALAAGALRSLPGRLTAGVLLGSLLWAIAMMIGAMLLSAMLARLIGGGFEGAWAYAGTIVGVLLTIPALRIIEHGLTWTGRQRIKARLARTFRYEFWPAWAFYLPLVPWFAWLSLRYRGLMTFSCCNPGIEGGGGIIGESKARIMDDLRHAGPYVLEAHLIEAGPTPGERTRRVGQLMDARPGLRGPNADGFPVILKPDGGQRGHAVRLARSMDDVRSYFDTMTRAAVVQKYHPGPRECGALWARTERRAPRSKQQVSSEGTAPGEEVSAAGYVFSITRKEFPVVTGDGRRTLEELIYAHPRLRCQARVFFTRFADDRSRVLARGEQLRLAVAGNHCQGTLFLDGADLVTPQLAAAIDAIARNFPRGEGDGLDFGRFDLRYESDEGLRAGRGFAIVELNGTTSESTNLYDPTRNILWAYGVLFRQWATLFRLGHARRRAGLRPVSLRELARSLRQFYRARPGSSVSD